MKKTNVLFAMVTLFAVQGAFATDYKCDDQLKTVVHYTPQAITVADQIYDLDATGISDVDERGIYLSVDNENPGKLEIGFLDSTDGGDLVDSWICAEVK
jgi:hypothetical protein